MTQALQVRPMPASPFGYGPFRWLIALRITSSAGSAMQTVAAGWLVLMLSGDPMAVGVLAALALGPSLVGSPVGGWLADRFCPRRLSIALAAIRIFPSAILAALAFSGNLTVPLIYVLILASAIPGSMENPITQLIIPYTVPQRIRYKAVAAASAARSVALFGGSLFGGVFVQYFGAGWAFGFNAATFVLGVAVFAGVGALQSACDLAKAHHDTSIREGISRGWAFPVVRTVAFGALTFFVLVAPIVQLMPVIAADHGSAMLLGVLLAAISVGAIVANAIISRYSKAPLARSRMLGIGAALGAPAILLLGVSHTVLTDVVLLFLVGFAWEMIFVSSSSVLEVDIPATIRGRLVGLLYLVITGSTAAGALFMGWAFSTFGVNASLLALGAFGVLVAFGVNLQARSVQPSR